MNITATRVLLILAAVLVVLSALPTPVISQANPAAEPQVLYLPIASNIRTTWVGPTGGTITALVAAPSDPQVLYAGSWGAGVFKSVDGGSTWRSVSAGLKNYYIQTIAVDPNNANILYTSTYKYKLYKSTNGGASWVESNNGIQVEPVIYSIAIDRNNTNIIYISTRGKSNNNAPPYNGVIYKSVDAGQSWSPVLQNVGAIQDWAYDVAVSPTNSSRVFAAFHQSGPWRSISAGETGTWEIIPNGSTSYGRSLVVYPEPGIGEIALMGAWTTNSAPGGVYKTEQAANPWVQWGFLAGELRGYDVYKIHQSPSDKNTLLLATFNNGVLISRDSGADWDPAGLGYQSIYSITSLGYTTFLAGTFGNAIQRTIDGGTSWSQVTSGLTAASVTGTTTHPSDDRILFAGTIGGGIFYSPDRGESWSQINTGLPELFIHDLVALPGSTRLFALTDSNGLFTVDLSGGWIWSPVNLGLPSKDQDVPGANFEPDRPLSGQITPEEEVMEKLEISSTTPGTLADTVSYRPFLSLAFSPSHPNIGYLGISTDPGVSAGGVWKTINSGTSWVPTGLSTSQSVYSIAVHPNNPKKVFAATSSTGVIKTSEDEGVSWTFLSLPGNYQANTVAFLPVDPARLFVGTTNGIYRLEDNLQFTLAGLPGLNVTALGTHPARPQMILAGTTNGAYRSLDGGSTWQSYPPQLDQLSIQTIDFDQTAGGPLWAYYGTADHGILRDQYD